LFNWIAEAFCQDECQLGDRVCSADNNFLLHCGDYDWGFDIDPCMEWPIDPVHWQSCPGGCGGTGFECEINPVTGLSQCKGTAYCITEELECPPECPEGARRCSFDSALGNDVIYECVNSQEEPFKGCLIWQWVKDCGETFEETGNCCPGGVRCQRWGEGELCDTQSECGSRRDWKCSEDNTYKIPCYLPDPSSNIWKWADERPDEWVICQYGCEGGKCKDSSGIVRDDVCQPSYSSHKCHESDKENWVQFARGTHPTLGCPMYVDSFDYPYARRCEFGCDSALGDCRNDPNPDLGDFEQDLCIVDHSTGALGETLCTDEGGYRQCYWDATLEKALWGPIVKCPSGRCFDGECASVIDKGYEFDMEHNTTTYLYGLEIVGNEYFIGGQSTAGGNGRFIVYYMNGTIKEQCDFGILGSAPTHHTVYDLAWDGTYVWMVTYRGGGWSGDGATHICRVTTDCDAKLCWGFNASEIGIADVGRGIAVDNNYLYTHVDDYGIVKIHKENVTYTGESYCTKIHDLDHFHGALDYADIDAWYTGNTCTINDTVALLTINHDTETIYLMQPMFWESLTLGWGATANIDDSDPIDVIKMFTKEGKYLGQFNGTIYDEASIWGWHAGIAWGKNDKKMRFLWGGDNYWTNFFPEKTSIEVWNDLSVCDNECYEGGQLCSGKFIFDCVKLYGGCWKYFTFHLFNQIDVQWAESFYGVTGIDETTFYSTCADDERCVEYWVNHKQKLGRCDNVACQSPSVCDHGESKCMDKFSQGNCTKINVNPNPFATEVYCWQWPERNNWTDCSPGRCLDGRCVAPLDECKSGSIRCWTMPNEGQLIEPVIGEKYWGNAYLQYCRDIDDDSYLEWDTANFTTCYWGCNSTFNISSRTMIAQCLDAEKSKIGYKAAALEVTSWLHILFPDPISRMFFVMIIAGALAMVGMILGGAKLGMFSGAVILILGMMTGWIPTALILIPIAIIGLWIYGKVTGGG